MAKFLSGRQLSEAIEKIIWDADKQLILISPFIKLDDHFKKLFENHERNPQLEIIVIFGKNEGDVSKSFNKSDFEYFKNFYNVTILYLEKLHAKFYANDSGGILTSINLYDYSFKNNIEFGNYIPKNFSTKLFKRKGDIWSKCDEMIEGSEVIYIKRPIYEINKNLLDIKWSRNYVGSKCLVDLTENFYGDSNVETEKSLKHYSDYKKEFIEDRKAKARPVRELEQSSNQSRNNLSERVGYCIRCSRTIGYDISRPLCKKCWQSWKLLAKEDFREKYCHKTGRESKGETSFANPIL